MANAMRTGFCTLDDVFRLRMRPFAPSAWKAERLLAFRRHYLFANVQCLRMGSFVQGGRPNKDVRFSLAAIA